MIRSSYFLVSLLFASLTACAATPADEAPSKAEARNQAAKADNSIDFCEIFDWYDDGECDDFCANPDPDCGGDQYCYSNDDCTDGTVCNAEEVCLSSCEPGQFCPAVCAGFCVEEKQEACTDGSWVQGPSSYVDATDGMQCEMPSSHCVTNDHGSCPQWSPLPPGYCSNGTIVTGASSFITSTDGMECEIPSVHCVTNDWGNCPQFSPLPLDYCEDGTLISGDSSFIEAAGDEMECEIPSVHCLTEDMSGCPQY